MDARKKLAELLYDNNVRCDQKIEGLADDVMDIIANGVTVQEWISVDDRLPEHGDVVLCFMKFGEQLILRWDNLSSCWLGYGHDDDWQKADVTYWMPLPELPKGE